MTDEMILEGKRIDAEVAKIGELKGRLDYLKGRSNELIKNLSYYTQMARVLTSELESVQHLIDDIAIAMSESKDEMELRIVRREVREHIDRENGRVVETEGNDKRVSHRERLGYDPILDIEGNPKHSQR